MVETAFSKEIIEEEGLSASALNNYLECPWKYFYQNLLRIPRARKPYLLYGEAMHKALDRFINKRNQEVVTHNFLIEAFEQEIYRLPLPKKETETLLARGKEALSGWIKENEIPAGARSEYKITHANLAPGVHLSGKLDRVDNMESGKVHVVDYKTGVPKSRNEIMGTTPRLLRQKKDSDLPAGKAGGNYYRQLLFYKLLLWLHEGGKYKFESGEINFLEPNDSGKFKKEMFTDITDAEVDELKQTILRVANEIRNFSFKDKVCNNKDCECCRLAGLEK